MSSEEKIDLMAKIVLALCESHPPILPYFNYVGLDLGQCRYCGVIGETEHVYKIVHNHKPECVTALYQQLSEAVNGTKQ